MQAALLKDRNLLIELGTDLAAADNGKHRPLAFDLGMHDGQDAAHYAKLGYNVVAVEAAPEGTWDEDPELLDYMKKGRVEVVRAALHEEQGEAVLNIKPWHEQASEIDVEGKPDNPRCRKIRVPAISVAQLVKDYGTPYFLKIDVESSTHAVLEAFSQLKCTPPYIQVEAHTKEILNKLYLMGYGAFKLTNMAEINAKFADTLVCREDHYLAKHSFRKHSSGPMGVNLKPGWINYRDLITLWNTKKKPKGAWYDVHATRLPIAPEEFAVTEVNVWNRLNQFLVRPPTFFDVGANQGQTVQAIKRRYPNCRLHSFEPQPAMFDQLQEVCTKHKRTSAWNFGLGEENGSLKFYLNSDPKCASFLPLGEYGLGNAVGEVSLPVRTLDSFCEDRGIQFIDCLKIDTQGFELSVLRGAKRLLKEGRIGTIMLEMLFLPLCSNQPNVSELYGILEESSFYSIDILNKHYVEKDEKKMLRWADFLFVHQDYPESRKA